MCPGLAFTTTWCSCVSFTQVSGFGPPWSRFRLRPSLEGRRPWPMADIPACQPPALSRARAALGTGVSGGQTRRVRVHGRGMLPESSAVPSSRVHRPDRPARISGGGRRAWPPRGSWRGGRRGRPRPPSAPGLRPACGLLRGGTGRVSGSSS